MGWFAPAALALAVGVVLIAAVGFRYARGKRLRTEAGTPDTSLSVPGKLRRLGYSSDDDVG